MSFEDVDELEAYERKLLVMSLTELMSEYQRHVGRLMIGSSHSAPKLIRAIMDKLHQQQTNSESSGRT